MAAIYKSVGIGNRKSRAEHRVLVEKKLGRRLGRFELVHHDNKSKRDNSEGNLKVVTPSEHAKIHLQKHPDTKTCENCGNEFTPGVNHRARTKTCSKECRYELVALSNSDPSGPRSKYRTSAYPSEVAVQKRRKRSLKQPQKDLGSYSSLS